MGDDKQLRLVRNERQMKALLDDLDPEAKAQVIESLRAMKPGQVTEIQAGETRLYITRGGK